MSSNQMSESRIECMICGSHGKGEKKCTVCGANLLKVNNIEKCVGAVPMFRRVSAYGT